MGKLTGKVAIVTGAGRMRGIGVSSAIALAKLGANVVVTGTGKDPEKFPEDEKNIGWKDVESTRLEIEKIGGRALDLITDVRKEKDVNDLIEKTLDKFHSIDILINNAAFGLGEDRKPVTQVEQNVFQKVLDIKVTGTFLCSKAVIPHMINQNRGGKIVNISSIMGKRGMPNTLAYNAANFAVIGMTQSMAKELGPHGINVNAVCPGPVDTSRMDSFGRDSQWDELAARSAIGRNGTAEEVGNFIAYLCTEDTSWITGQSINIDGGTVMEH
ncbi:MAG: SDR family oxidoreductase [SAR202 cluster bacterium]|nr:SDR family oxidoreductase [SAR202 cluster bacterium]|tara:strand:+ start:54238 stop:55050 length:813 start_codon:yes stop_codon:yes gene_type:complete